MGFGFIVTCALTLPTVRLFFLFFFNWQFRLSRFLSRFLISMKEIYKVITTKINKPRLQTTWSFNNYTVFIHN